MNRAISKRAITARSAHQHLRSGTQGTLAAVGSDKVRPLAPTGMTLEGLARQAEGMAFGTPDEVTERIIEEAEEAGANTALLICNRGALPQEMFLNQIRRLGKEVLPRLKAHKISGVKFAEGI